jgi:flavodoxin
MFKTLIVYSSKYGTTREVARTIALITGPAKFCSVDEFKDDYKDFEFIVIGTPIYQEKLDPTIVKFIEENRNWLNKKPVSVFCTCLDKNGGLSKLNELQDTYGKDFLSLKTIGGRLILDVLDEDDHAAIKTFLDTVKLPFEDMDFYNPREVVNYSLKLKSIKEDLIVPIDIDQLKGAVDEFLNSHNTCTLATCNADKVRSTPIEYNYYDGNLYLLSEGGEKFANLILNDNVSVSIYNDYSGMNNLAGMQITGKAFMVAEYSEEYNKILNLKGLNVDVIKSLPVNMNMIKIMINKIEFLNSNFKMEGAEAKQILYY